MTFRVGMKVVCINAEGLSVSKFTPLPCEGSIYTIRDIRPENHGSPQGVAGLFLEEILGEINPLFGLEYSFLATRFRPLVERKTDIAVFRRILKSSKRGVAA